MGIAWQQGLTVASHIFRQRMRRTEKYALVLMLEPLFRCNLECIGCGKIQYPEEILNQRLNPEACEAAALECGAPVVSIAGGEPLIHPEIAEIVERLVVRKKFVYLCTNALLLRRRLEQFKPSPYLCLSVHLDGLEEVHDRAVCRKGVFREAVEGIKAAKKAGFQVSTNTTIYLGADPAQVRRFFDFLMDLGVDGMMISPGYPYEKAPDQDHFLKREQIKALFRKILENTDPRWHFNHSAFYLEFLQGKRSYDCTAWGNPTRNVLGWQKPCYMMSDGHASSYQALLEETPWERYGTGRDSRCAECMVHCGYEPSAVADATQSLSKMFEEVRLSNRRTSGARERAAVPAEEPTPLEAVSSRR